ncbi:hypothetical protein CSA56_15080 [candidate division KSB3 bacterium]|uniref:Uncharacterized protein n=1 Tax=candidate division KSB3 bacterium TaxID=2044937 RepID=A0A2G6K9Z1_9BACT|nr:MAG: hypothetical protein CSA56_15080 [candidate division KSB3 bacterium]
MKKTILCQLFGFGSSPKKLLSVLEQERVVVLDEGINGWFVTKHVNGPGSALLEDFASISSQPLSFTLFRPFLKKVNLLLVHHVLNHISFMNLDVNMIIMPCGMKSLKPDFWQISIPSDLQMRFYQNFLNLRLCNQCFQQGFCSLWIDFGKRK